VAVVALATALAAANRGRLSLRCIDGELEARRGRWLPWGDAALAAPELPPLPVPAARCRDRSMRDRAALETAWVEELEAAVVHAVAEGSAAELSALLDVLELRSAAGEDRSETLDRRRRAILAARARIEVERARAARERASTHIEDARAAGLDDRTVRELEAGLAAPPGEPTTEPRPPADEVPPGGRAL
jgi:hypothetical protein